MRRSAIFSTLTVLALVAPSGAAQADHPAPGFSSSAPLSTAFNSGGDGADWSLDATFPTGNPHTDIDFFTQGDTMYAVVGTLAVGPNAGGATIIKLMEGGEQSFEYVSSAPTAACISNPANALGLQHDVEATPKGNAILNAANPFADRSDAQLIIDATDAPGRCHDQATLGLETPDGSIQTPQGGLEIIDITDVENPVEIGLTSHIGEAHTVNIDPKRPHIAYAVTSDAVGVSGTTRANESPGSDALDLDGFEVVDLSSCMNFPEGTSVADKRASCQPDVYRYRYPSLDMVLGHTNTGTVYGCHELEIYPDDRLTCGSGSALIVLDMRGAFDDMGTPDDYSDDRPVGTPLPCQPRASSSIGPFATGATVQDCVVGEGGVDLSVPGWIAEGAPSLEGVEWIGTAYHMGRTGTTQAASPAFPSTEDIDFNHEAEFTHSGKFVIASDERGGGVLPPGAACSPGIDNPIGNGGVHAYRVEALRTTRPDTSDEAFEAYARTPDGEKAIYRTPIQSQSTPTECTAHVFHQIPGQNRIFMAWYSQGTRVVDYVEHEDGTFEWIDVAYFVPEAANTWSSAIYAFEENADGTWTYHGATGDFQLGNGRSAIDLYTVTLPPPAQFAAAGDEPAPAPAPQPAPEAAPAPLPVTGGGIALGALALLGTAASFGRRRRLVG